MSTIDPMPIKAIANWFGRDGAVVDRVAAELEGCSWIGVPFAGGMGALSALKCNQGVASDLHCHVVNLAAVLADPQKAEEFAERLAAVPHHQVVYWHAQARCAAVVAEHAWEASKSANLFYSEGPTPTPGGRFLREIADVGWAVDYFIVSWMGRAGESGQIGEFDWKDISVRWKATGGSSSSRWRSAVASVPGWANVLKRWSFLCLDAFEFVQQCLTVEKRTAGELKNGLYLDPPFPDVGEPYTHTFTEADQIELARLLSQIKKTRVVVRYHNHPLIKKLYPESSWTWLRMDGRAQTNDSREEVLLINGPSYTADWGKQ